MNLREILKPIETSRRGPEPIGYVCPLCGRDWTVSTVRAIIPVDYFDRDEDEDRVWLFSEFSCGCQAQTHISELYPLERALDDIRRHMNPSPKND